MRKRKFKNYLKTGILLLGILFTLSNCEKEIEISESNKIKISIIGKKELLNNPKIIENLEKIEIVNSKLHAKGKNNPEQNFTINTNYVKYIENGDLHSYTFPINRNINKQNIENLVLYSTKKGNYTPVLVEYEVSKKQLLNIKLEDLNKTKVIYTPIKLDYSSLIDKNSAAKMVCNETWELVEISYMSIRDWETHNYEWVLVSSNCFMEDSDETSLLGGGYNEGNYNGDGNGGGGYPTTSPTVPDNEINCSPGYVKDDNGNCVEDLTQQNLQTIVDF